MNNLMNPYFATGVQPNSFYQPPLIPQGLKGKLIDKPEDIQIQDIPNDGSLGVYPCKDNDYILTKQWTSNGSIKTTKFVREDEPDQTINIEDLVHRIEELEKRLKATNKTKEP